MLIQLTPTFLTAPGSLSVSAISQTTLRLTWTASSGANLAGYRVYVATDPNQAYTLLTSTAVGVLTYDHATLTGGSTRYYRVTAYDSNNNETGAATGFGTTIANDTTAPTAPVISATAVSSSTINLTLVTAADDASGIASYAVERSPNGSTGWTVLTSAATFPYSATGLSASTVYYFRARATDASSNANVGPYSSVVNATTQAASLPAAGFSPASGFSVSGTASHGNAIVVTRSSGAFAARTYSPNPWLYDIVSAQYKDGVALDVYGAVSDGATAPTNAAVAGFSSGADAVKIYRSRATRHARVTAQYSQLNVNSAMKLMVGPFVWPSSWNGGTQNNARLYVSWWEKNRFTFGTRGSSYQHKLSRFNSTSGAGIGFSEFNPDSFQASPGASATKFSQPGSANYMTQPPDNAWVRYEMFLDRVNGRAEGYIGYRYQRGGSSGLARSGFPNGEFEYRSVGDALYDANSANVAWVPGWPNIECTLGYDGNTADHSGQELDVGEIYVDADWERFEISDSPTWNVANALTVGTPREIQGRWSRDSSTQCTVYVNQGQFSTLVGKYLWYVDNFKTATLVGQFT